MADLVLAMAIAVLTFNVAYRACVVLGAVLLQTSPPRGLANGKMEAFLRAMREVSSALPRYTHISADRAPAPQVERHPHVLHLPAPHIWQLTPSLKAAPVTAHTHDTPPHAARSAPPAEALVVTLELHVREDLGDADVLALTRWAWERCVSALGSVRDYREPGEEGGMEVTVGVVKG